MNTSSMKFDSVIRKRPEFSGIAQSVDRLVSTKNLKELDPDAIASNLSNSYSAEEITLFVAATVEAGLGRLRFRVRDDNGNLTAKVFDDYKKKPVYAEDRFLNRFRVKESNIVPVLELY